MSSNSGVKMIFKVLIGTVVIMVAGALIVEMMNVSLTAIKLQTLTKMACNKALDLFCQETYKQRDATGAVVGDATAGGSIAMIPVVASDGTEYISGDFYNSNATVAEIYNELYGNGRGKSEFAEWLKGKDSRNKTIAGNWKAVDGVNRYLNNNNYTQKTVPDYNYYVTHYSPIIADMKFDEAVDEYSNYMEDKQYVEAFMTPLNFGVPYIDEETANKIFRWNLGKIMSDCDSNTIVADENGKYCIQREGFRIYADQARITSIEYKIYDLTKSSDKKAFEKLTNIDSDNLEFGDWNSDRIYFGTNKDERQHICIIGVNYSVPVCYVGVTPIRSIFSYVWNMQVEGLKDQAPEYEQQELNTSTSDLQGGGFNGNSSADEGVLPVPGKLIFYLVR